VPEEVDERIETKAIAWRGDATTPADIAIRLSEALKREYSYSATMVAPEDGKNALGFFLFNRKAGHCEYFASALALMLRQSGVHSRIVTGYRGATFNQFGGYYSLQEYRAHSWVEYFVPNLGWARVDPTPAASEHDSHGTLERISAFVDVLKYRWNRYILEYDLDLQVDAVRALRKSWKGTDGSKSPTDKLLSGRYTKYVIGAVGLLLLVIIARSVRRNLRPTGARDMQATKIFQRLEKTLVRRGVRKRPPSESALQYIHAAADADKALAEPLDAFADAYLRARFSPEINPSDLDRMTQCVQAVARAGRQHDGGPEVR